MNWDEEKPLFLTDLLKTTTLGKNHYKSPPPHFSGGVNRAIDIQIIISRKPLLNIHS